MTKFERSTNTSSWQGRYERRGLRWWWVYESGNIRAEFGPYWFKRNLEKEVIAWITQ